MAARTVSSVLERVDGGPSVGEAMTRVYGGISKVKDRTRRRRMSKKSVQAAVFKWEVRMHLAPPSDRCIVKPELIYGGYRDC